MNIQSQIATAAPLSKQALVDYFAAGCKPKSAWRIGTEHEKFPFRISTLQPVSYDEPKGIRDLLQVLKLFGWKEIREADQPTALRRGGASISLEPGGQIELSGAPHITLHETASEFDQHLEELKDVESLLDIAFLGMGFHPTARRADMPWMPKQRYHIMRSYLPTRGTHGIDMMQRTATTQVNLDYADEADMALKMRLGMALQPIVSAIFSASPFLDGKVTGYQSWRQHVWQHTDPARCQMLSFVFNDDFSFARYVDYALSVPMIAVYRGERIIDVAGQSFGDFMAGKLPMLPGDSASIVDWENHLGTLFPPVRLRQYLEMRGADCGNAEAILALPALWTGLLYDETACLAAWDLVRDWSIEDHLYLAKEAPQYGLHLPFRNGTVCDIARRITLLAQQGLRRRAHRLHGAADESRYLEPLITITESGQSYADDLVGFFEHHWHGDINQVFVKCRL